MITYYTMHGNEIIKLTTNDNGSTNHQILTMELNNIEYQAYLKWLEEGNTPLPADE